MRTAIFKDVDSPVLVPGDQNLMRNQDRANKIPGLFQLTFVRDVEPHSAKNSLQLQFENFGICVNTLMNSPWTYQGSNGTRRYRFGRELMHHGSQVECESSVEK